MLSGNPSSIKNLFHSCGHSWWGFAEGTLKVEFFTVLCFRWSVKKHCVPKILRGIYERFSYENNHKSNIYKFSYKFSDIAVLSEKPKKRIRFSARWWSGDLVFLFIVYRESRSSSKACLIQLTFIKGFSYMLFHLVL